MDMLSGKTVVIIGGAGLLGSEFSRACAAAGARVTIADKNAKKGQALADEISASFCAVDVTDDSSMTALAEQLGQIDGVVNATYPKTAHFGTPFEDGKVSDMLENLGLHIGACLTIAKVFPPIMKRGGAILFLGSIYGIAAPRLELYANTAMIGIPPEYTAAKAGVIALVRQFAKLFGKDNIRVNAVSPGGIADGQPESFVTEYSKHLALGKGLLLPEDISGAVVFLLSDAARKITGQNIVIDAGWTL